MQLDQPRAQIRLRRIEGGAGTERQSAIQPLLRQIERHHIGHTAIDQPQHHGEADRAAAEHDDLIARLGLGPVDTVEGDGERLERAKALGAKAAINPATDDVRAGIIAAHGTARVFGREAAATDAYLDAAGGPTIVNDVIKMAKAHAKLVVTAAYMKPVEVNFSAMLTTEMSITTAVGYPDEMPEVVASLPRLKDKAASLISHRYQFGDVIEALGVAGTPQSAKVMIGFDEAVA